MTDQTVEQALDLVPEAGPEAPPPRLQRFQWLGILRNASRLTRTRIGLGMVGFIVLIALFGPLFAPHSPTEFVSAPNHGPTSDAIFGADALGRDVFSRFLYGGLSVLWMSATATLIGVVIGTAVGLVAAYSRNWLDDVLMRLNDVVLAFPQIIFVLLAVTPYISRIMRGSMIEVLESEYVTMARLKGLPERTVIWRHAVPNAIVPAIQVTALQLAWMAGGVVMVEFVFSYPGIGSLFINAVDNRDMPVVQTITLLAAAIYVVLNLLADLATIAVTPRLRTEAR